MVKQKTKKSRPQVHFCNEIQGHTIVTRYRNEPAADFFCVFHRNRKTDLSSSLLDRFQKFW